MKIAIYSIKDYEKEIFQERNINYGFELGFFEFCLDEETVDHAKDFDAICIFVNDNCNEKVLKKLAVHNVRFIALRCAGFNNVDLYAARKLGLCVVNVPSYSPQSIAEYTVGLILSLSRKIHIASQRTRCGNFSLSGLKGFDMHNKTVGVIGTGKIGIATIKILRGFGMRVLASDICQNQQALELGALYVGNEKLYHESDIVTLHCPLTQENHHMLNGDSIEKMKDGVMIINTSRGGLLDSHAVINGLKSGKIGSVGMDVYENESSYFFEDKSNNIICDDALHFLSNCPNVLLTGHQAFLTEEALCSIVDQTFNNLIDLQSGMLEANILK
jgi:D-lactate dehydrogenase